MDSRGDGFSEDNDGGRGEGGGRGVYLFNTAKEEENDVMINDISDLNYNSNWGLLRAGDG